MKVLVVGHPIKILDIKEIIEDYDDMEVSIYNIIDLGDIIEKKDELSDEIFKNDITIMSGKITYKWVSKHLIIPDTVTYVPKNSESLLRAFLEAKNKGYDITRVSLDSYSPARISDIYSEINIDMDEDSILAYDPDVFDEDLIDKQRDFHMNAYEREGVTCCITGVSDVYEILEKKGLPVVMIKATKQTVRDVYEKVKLEKMLSDQSDNELVFIYVDIKVYSESMNMDNDYNFILERMNVIKEIYQFSHLINAAIESVSMSRFILVAKRKYLARETNFFNNIRLLSNIEKNTMSRINMGIGFGETPRMARHNAFIGIKKSVVKDRSCAYIVYSKDSMEGPLYSHKEDEEKDIVDERFLDIANSSGLSLNTIFKLYGIICKFEKNAFTINELANYYETSLRTMYRIMEKLELAGYVDEVGRKTVTSTGRPSRLLKINLR